MLEIFPLLTDGGKVEYQYRVTLVSDVEVIMIGYMDAKKKIIWYGYGVQGLFISCLIPSITCAHACSGLEPLILVLGNL